MSGDSQKLLELAEKVEKAEGPDGYLDVEIKFAIAGQKNLGGGWAEVIATGERVRVDYLSPFYTASLDAALTLVSPEDSWTLSRLGDGLFWCSISFPDDEADNFTGTGKRPALAMVPAALRARAAQIDPPACECDNPEVDGCPLHWK